MICEILKERAAALEGTAGGTPELQPFAESPVNAPDSGLRNLSQLLFLFNFNPFHTKSQVLLANFPDKYAIFVYKPTAAGIPGAPRSQKLTSSPSIASRYRPKVMRGTSAAATISDRKTSVPSSVTRNSPRNCPFSTGASTPSTKV